MANYKKRNILAMAGIISTVVGIIVAIPSALKGETLIAVIAVLLVIIGLVLLAISFGD